jgi:vacuolar-type H+-ATPase subunit I/STV1
MKNNTVREVVSSQYLPGKSKLDNPLRPILHQRLLDWESNLPPEMQFQPSMAREVMFLVGMLHMTYAYVVTPSDIVRFRPSLTLLAICISCCTDQYSCNHRVNQQAQKGT